MIAALAYPNIDPIALRLGPFTVRWYGIAYLLGFLAAWWFLKILDERWEMGLGPDGRTTTIFAAIIGLVLGARLGYVAFYGAGAYWRDPVRILQIWDGGFSFLQPQVAGGVAVFAHIGGFAFGAATIFLVAKRRPRAPSSKYPVY